MIRYLIGLLALIAAPLAAQIVTSPAPIPDSNKDGAIRLDAMAAKVNPAQKRGTVVLPCGGLVYAVKGTPCPAPPKPTLPLIQGANKNGVVALAPRVGPMRVSGAFRVIETTTKSKADGVTIDGIEATDLQRGGIRLRGQLSNVVIRDSSFRFRATPQVSPNLPACMEVGEKGATTRIVGLLVQNVTCDGFQMTMEPNRYWNGDGPTFEHNVQGLRLENVVSRNSTDGCFDIKVPVTGTSIEAEGCRRNVRLWKPADFERVTSITPIKRGGSSSPTHFWIKGNNASPPTIHIGTLIVRSTNTAPIFTIEDGAAHIVVDRCQLQVPPGTPFKVGGAKGNVLTLGEGCR